MDNFQNLIQGSPLFFIALYIWSLFWKGIALWRASHGKQKNWFIALLVLNTMGIIEILFLFKFAHKPLTISEMRTWISSSPKKD